MTWAGCYSLDLYCDNAKPPLPGQATDGVHAWDEFPHQFTDELGSVCRAEARKAGWIIRMDGSCICPKCSGKKQLNGKAEAA
jgi:hypothetical protein